MLAGGGADADVDEAPLGAFAADLLAEELGAGGDPQRELERERLAALRRLRVERRVVLLEAVQHPGHRPLDHDARANLDLVRAPGHRQSVFR